jgi:exonuclease VII large subunit
MTDTTTDLIARLDDVADALECFGEDKHPADIRKEAARDIREAIGTIERLSQQVAELKRENFALAAGQCIHDDGLSSDDGGTPYCKKQQRIAALESELAEEKETRRAYEEECQATCAEGIKYWKDRCESQLAARESAEPVAWLTEDGRIAKDETKQCMPSASRENFTIPLFAHPLDDAVAAIAAEKEKEHG